MIGDDYCLLGYGPLYSAMKWSKFQKKKTAGQCLRQNIIIIIPPWSWLCQIILKRPISASLHALHPWRWQAIFVVRALWGSYLTTYRDVRFRETYVIYFSRRKSGGLTKWSCDVLLPFRLAFNDVWSVLHLRLLDIFLCVHVLHFRTAALQSASIITGCHWHKHKTLCNKYCGVWVCTLDWKPVPEAVRSKA